MITLEMCLEYLKHPKRNFMLKDTYPSWLQPPIELTKAQEKFLGNLCEGKLTDTPRGFGKTFIIKLYCECLDYYMDMVKYDPNIKKDDYISLEETINSWKPYGISPYQPKRLVEIYNKCENPEKALREYNSTAEYMEKLKQEIEEQQND